MRRTVPFLVALSASLCAHRHRAGQGSDRRFLPRHQGPVHDHPGGRQGRQARRLDPDRPGRLQDPRQVRSRNAEGRTATSRRGADHHAEPSHPRHEPQHGDRRRDQARLGALQHRASAQNFGAKDPASGGSVGSYARTATAPTGLNGLMVWKARNVSIENLTACNFLGGAADAGNEIWWNGGADSGKVGGHGFYGGYLTATSTYLKGKSTAGEFSAAQYGIFSSNWSGGTWDQIYACNFNDSGFYIGACQQVCNQTVNHAWAEFNALGYSGSNSGGRLVIENSAVRQQRGRVRHQQPERRQPVAPERRLPRQRGQPDHPHPLVLGVHAQLRPRQQQPQRARGGVGGGRSGGHRHVGLRRPQRHGDGQPVREQRRLGRRLRPVSGQGKPAPAARSTSRSSVREAVYSRTGRRRDRQQVQRQRGLRQPHQRRLRRARTSRAGTRSTATGATPRSGRPLSFASAAAHADRPPDLHRRSVPGSAVDPPSSSTSPVRHPGRACRASRLRLNGPVPARDEDRHAPAAASSLKTMPNPCQGVPRTRGAEAHPELIAAQAADARRGGERDRRPRPTPERRRA